ncbi:group III truncated hemoglobin [Pollutimonas thiosulfatoxidans]|uniref:Preprotein translocase subunit TatC n=1 Tax=Pollutimonas thiosulfatoxidans TaxID=2028345 RepID=A0A410G8B8_9BURK|nr:group III truncated hemoglobin [Pollutimonas thiosulfatoxidans]MBF6615368.1 group III truncated hemoglobin [Candidimonas sp.]NYT43742.1 group III truncated hemoglobin [Alcaligenaceae bacterium]QAA92516.1 preprotein translocase subunit TatC [Pollutimonas thiosulfatoxidans]
MARPDFCTEEDITALVHGFYGRVRADAMLAPVFDAQIQDWDKHLAIMCRFWSSLLRGSGTYTGTPMPKHVALPGLTADMFHQWLSLFRETTQQFSNPEFAERAQDFAERIARSLWFGYQINNEPERLPTELAHD